jgi:alpha-glucoside transport system permease protein
MKRSLINKKLNKIPTHFIIIFTMVIWMVPTIGLFITSFRPLPLINTTGWWTFLSVDNIMNTPKAAAEGETLTYGEKLSNNFTLNNYIDAIVGYRGTKTYVADCSSGSQSVSLKCNASDFLSPRGMGSAFVNSLIVTIPATILPVFFAAFAGYAFAWLDFKGRFLLFSILVGLQVVPLQMTLVPVLKMYAGLGMTGTFLGVWLFHTGFGLPYAIYLMRNFLGGLPRDLFEAAYLDGASHWTTFTNLVIPLAMPAIASLGIYQFLWVWNDLLVALVFLGGTKPVMTYQISNMVTSLGAGWHLLTAAAFLSMILPMIVFFALQRYFVRGMLAGAVKG